MLSVVTIVVHEDLHNQWERVMPMRIGQYQVIIASAHVIPSVSDSFEVNTSLFQPFSSILVQVLSNGGRQAVE